MIRFILPNFQKNEVDTSKNSQKGLDYDGIDQNSNSDYKLVKIGLKVEKFP